MFNQVFVVWRDAYTAATLLCVCVPPGASHAKAAACASDSNTATASAPQPNASTIAAQSLVVPANGATATACSEGSALAEALRQLDMAALLGGPLFRPALDACISTLQVLYVAFVAEVSLPNERSGNAQQSSYILCTHNKRHVWAPSLQDECAAAAQAALAAKRKPAGKAFCCPVPRHIVSGLCSRPGVHDHFPMLRDARY